MSRTAQIVAAARMQHLSVDARPPIVDDPFAELLLGDDAETLRGLLGSLPDEVASALRAAVTVRSRVAEDRARAAAELGPARYVLLGAGLDSAAWRLADLDLEIVEIDQADVLADKRSRAAAAGLAIPDTVRYVAADFTDEPVSAVLSRVTNGPPRQTVLAWCGVTQYLPESVISATLDAVATLLQGTELVFTVVIPDEDVPEHLRDGARQIAEIAAASGEPFVTRLSSERAAALLANAGLELVADMGAAELASLFRDRDDGLEPVEAERVVIAAVG